MRRTLTLALAGALALGACSSGDDTAEADPTTTDAPTTTTTERATTTTEPPPDVAGLVTPPAGFTQAQADAFTSNMVVTLDDAGWPSLDRDDSIAILQEAATLAGASCDLAGTTAGLPGSAGTDVVEAAISHLGREQQPALAAEVEAAGDFTAEEARGMADGYVRGIYLGAGEHLCPQYAASFEAAAALYL